MSAGGGIGQSLLNAARSAAPDRVSHRHSDGTPDLGAADTVGPNAIIQTRAALIETEGVVRTRRLFVEAGIADWYDEPPHSMVPAEAVHRLNSRLLASLDGSTFDAVMRDAGHRTGHYILDNRIPGPAKAVLKLLPAPLAARMLLKAIRSNSWTFAGQAEVAVTPGHPALIEIVGNPLPMPGCPWHSAVFETLFSTLLCRPVHVTHRILGVRERLDRFELRWRD
ncbi:bacteriochlorophyll 4-vinyl reductase [Hoeflea olei]|uniref:Bacteriochlorophyll 4-vinyl reductase n=1 Tax=Hoeflea olei TaxID=1480615 RepID=A0A1C1YYC4_9HYPH|nr:bacteriochlorophyll 4-vinyl reductase [Hoeflea olei]OCW58467.1 hypothetical protein AWJ14_18385 [Hoeflea olei]